MAGDGEWFDSGLILPVLDELTEILNMDLYADSAASFPSRGVNVLDIPRPRKFKAGFHYNFFEKNENLQDATKFLQNASPQTLKNWGLSAGDGVIRDVDAGQPGADFELKVNLSNVLVDVPRWVEFSWMPAEILAEIYYGNGEPSSQKYEDNELLIRDNLNSLIDESFFASSGYSAIPFSSFHLQDNSIARDVSDIYNVAASIVKTNYPDVWPGKEYEVIYDKLVAGDVESGYTGFKGHPGIENFLQALKGKSDEIGINVFSGETGNIIKMPQISRFSEHVQHGLINGKFVGDIVTRMTQDSRGPFAQSVSNDLAFALGIQGVARQNSNPESMSLSDYNLIFPDIAQLGSKVLMSVDWPDVDASALPLLPWVVSPLGLLVEKFEVGTDPEGFEIWIKRDPVVFGSPYHFCGIDINVKCNTTYVYRPRTVATATCVVFDQTDGIWRLMEVLLVSKPANSVIVHTDPVFQNDPDNPIDPDNPGGDGLGQGSKPPDWPRDLKFVWDYVRDELTFHWSFPPERERDVKYFKIFRRGSIYEPFQILNFYDFNDILGPKAAQMYDWIRPSLMTTFLHHQLAVPDALYSGIRRSSFKRYLDSEFTKDSQFIYAVMAGDAHGQWSNYSTQFVVSFDKINNKLKVEMICPPGAPEPYPNWFITADIKHPIGKTEITTDAMKISNYDSIAIAFDPDARAIVQTKDGNVKNDLNFLLVDKDQAQDQFFAKGRYLMQINNLDTHQTKHLRITLKSRKEQK